jgi:hypothetical protein
VAEQRVCRREGVYTCTQLSQGESFDRRRRLTADTITHKIRLNISSPPVAVVTHHRPTLGIVVVSDLVVAAHDVEAAVGGRMLESSSPPPAVRAIVVGVAATNDAALSAISALQVPERLTATQPVATHIRSALGHS